MVFEKTDITVIMILQVKYVRLIHLTSSVYNNYVYYKKNYYTTKKMKKLYALNIFNDI
jgi:hypothetical protein